MMVDVVVVVGAVELVAILVTMIVAAAAAASLVYVVQCVRLVATALEFGTFHIEFYLGPFHT